MPFATEENLTDLALKQWEACHSPRLRQIMQSLVNTFTVLRVMSI